VKRNPSEIFRLITTTATYKVHRKTHIILRSISGKSFPDAIGQELLTALRQPIQSSSYCRPQTKSNDACSPLRVYGVGEPRVHFFTPLGGCKLAVQFTSESKIHLHLCLAGGRTIDLNHFNKSRFLIISPFHMQCVGGRGSIQCRRPSV